MSLKITPSVLVQNLKKKKLENSNFLPFLTEIIPFWPPDGPLGLIRKSPSRAQRPISAVKIPHSPLSPLSSAKQPVSEDVPENKRAHHNHCGLWLRPIHGLTTMNTAKSQMKVLISPLHSIQREKGFPFNNFPLKSFVLPCSWKSWDFAQPQRGLLPQKALHLTPLCWHKSKGLLRPKVTHAKGLQRV